MRAKSWSARSVFLGLCTLLVISMLAACSSPQQPAAAPSAQPAAPSEATGAAPAPAPAPAPVKATELNFGFYAGPGHVATSWVIQPFADIVAERSKGQVKTNIHLGGALGPSNAQYDNTIAGVMDVAFGQPAFTPGRFPLTTVMDLPFMFKNAKHATEVFWRLYEEFPELQAEYKDVKLLAVFVHEPGTISTRSKPIRALEDLRGLQIRAVGPVQVQIVEALGATAVQIAPPDVFNALERNVVAGVLQGLSAVSDYNLQSMLKYSVVPPVGMYTTTFYVVMNKQKYESLSPDGKAAIDSLAGMELSLMGAAGFKDGDNKGKKLLEEAGTDFITMDAAQYDKWSKALEPVAKKWIEEREKAGLPGQKIYDRARQLAQEIPG